MLPEDILIHSHKSGQEPEYGLQLLSCKSNIRLFNSRGGALHGKEKIFKGIVACSSTKSLSHKGRKGCLIFNPDSLRFVDNRD